MSNQYPPPESQYMPQAPQYPPYQPAPLPPKKSKFKRFLLPVGLLLLGLVIGGSAGASAVPEPVVQVQEKVVTKEVEVTVTPVSCLKAIQHAEEVIDSSGRVVVVFSDILDAVKKLDADEIYRLNPKIDAETAVLQDIKPKYHAARDACQASR